MKNIIIVLILSVVCLTINSQQINLSNNRYRGNDALEKKQVTVKGFDLNSKNSVWNLEDAELSKATYHAEYTTETDTLMEITKCLTLCVFDNLVQQTFVHAALASQFQITQITFGEFQRELCHRRL